MKKIPTTPLWGLAERKTGKVVIAGTFRPRLVPGSSRWLSARNWSVSYGAAQYKIVRIRATAIRRKS